MNIQNIWIVIYKMKGERAYILGRYDSEELAKKMHERRCSYLL